MKTMTLEMIEEIRFHIAAKKDRLASIKRLAFNIAKELPNMDRKQVLQAAEDLADLREEQRQIEKFLTKNEQIVRNFYALMPADQAAGG